MPSGNFTLSPNTKLLLQYIPMTTLTATPNTHDINAPLTPNCNIATNKIQHNNLKKG